MKGNDALVKMLQNRYAEQHAAIVQYMTQSEIAKNWGFEKLGKELRDLAIAEMKHAEQHLERIIFLEFIPEAIKISPVYIGKNVPEFLEFGREGETTAIKLYAATIKVARDFGDIGTAEYLEKILRDEEYHLNYFEAQLAQITQMGVQNYLATKTRE